MHARELARQAKNKWDRGAYVRWAVTSAWTALEMVCGDTLHTKGIGRRFKENLDAAIKKNNIPALDWGSGIWQRIATLCQTRKDFVHVNASQAALFLAVEVADSAVTDIRAAIQDLFACRGKVPPPWIEDDGDRGWDNANNVSHGHVVQSGANPSSPSVVKVVYVYKGKEHISDILRDGTDPEKWIEYLIRNTTVPISGVRVYVGTKLVIDRELPMRGT